MASSSSPSTSNSHKSKYDAFISFRGADVRSGFLSHLCEAFNRNCIDVFKDENLDRGEEISLALLEKIEESYMSIVIFSENYADSPWCLDELVKILECKEKKGMIVVPVFYKVDSSHVQDLTGSFKTALDKHRTMYSLQKLESWTRALTTISNLSGRVSQNMRHESELIEDVVKDVLRKLNYAYSSDSYDDGLVGVDSRVKKVESLLCNESKDVRAIGIWGMGGIGKTTIAAKVYEQNKDKFDSAYFVANVAEEIERRGVSFLRAEILGHILQDYKLKLHEPLVSQSSIRRRLRRTKALIVLDDVRDTFQMTQLIGASNWYGEGSRIILTSRDKQPLRNACTEEYIYEIKTLTDHEALLLFTKHAFKQNHPIDGYVKLSKRAIRYARGNPLALRVLGSNFCSNTMEQWEYKLASLESSPDMAIQKILKNSYDALDDNEKKIFLDIACFFEGQSRDRVENILNGGGFNATSGISILKDKSFIIICSSNNVIGMHDLLREMAKDIVYQESHGPGERSRLWNPRDIVRVLTEDQGTDKIQAISLDMSKIPDVILSARAFMRMHNLRILKFYNPFNSKMKLYLPEGLDFLPSQITYLQWEQYPLQSLPSSFNPRNLVQLELPHSRIEQLWNGVQELDFLVHMDLSYSTDLINIPDLSKAPNLQFVNLEGCTKLVEVPSSIGHGRKLTHLNLNECKSLCSLPSCLQSTRLEFLSLRNCSRITRVPHFPPVIKRLNLSGTAIEEVPSSIGRQSQLVKLELASCTSLKSLPCSIGKLISLQMLDLEGCSELVRLPKSICNLKSLECCILRHCERLKRLPEDLGNLKSLKKIDATFSGIKELPSSINRLRNLVDLRYSGHGRLTLSSLEELSSLRELSFLNCGIKEIPNSISLLVSLRELDLSRNDFRSLPATIKQLSFLTVLNVSHCKTLQYLPELPSSLELVDAPNCISLESVPRLFTEGEKDYGDFMGWFDFGNCIKLGANACNKIMDEAYMEIQSIAAFLSCQEPNDEEDDDCIPDLCGIGLCIPGTEVPRWFSCRNTGSSMSLRLKAQYHNDKLLACCAFCVVFACRGGNTCLLDIRCGCRCHLITESGDALDFESEYQWGQYLAEKEDINLESEHMFFWFESNFFRSKYRVRKASFEFYAKDTEGNIVQDSYVIKCGVHPLFAENGHCQDNEENKWGEDENEEEEEEVEAEEDEEEEVEEEEEEVEDDDEDEGKRKKMIKFLKMKRKRKMRRRRSRKRLKMIKFLHCRLV